MLSVGVCQQPQQPPCARPSTRRRISGAASFSIQVCQSDLSASQLSFPLSSLSLERSGVRLFALNKRRNGGGGNANAVVSEEEDEDSEGEDLDDGEDDENLDVVVSFDELGDWLQKKPRGFGGGKEYDTSLEEKLLEEIAQSRRAQLANIKKLKGLSPDPKKQLNEETEAVPIEASVRISNLPKKRNIERDLKAAFKGTPGIVSITPLVSGNKKTKDPICKGLAFVNFKSLEDAQRFIDTFSSQAVTFGKIDKQIKCELLDNTRKVSEKKLNDVSPMEGESDASSGDEDDLDESWDSESGDEDIVSGLESPNASDAKEINRIEQKLISMAPSAPSTASKGRNQAATKAKSKGRSKGKSSVLAKVPKISAAAKRLQPREKAMLADVFSRYGSKMASGSKES